MPSSRALRVASALLPILASVVPASAQTAPAAFLDAAPALPQRTCGASREERRAFERQAHDVASGIEREIGRREKEARAAEEKVRAQAEAGIVARSGFTAQEVEGSRAGGRAREAAMDSAMQRQAGMSMEQARALAAMSLEERRAWAMAHAGELGRAPRAAGSNPAPTESLRLQQLNQHAAELTQALGSKEQRLKRRLEELDAAAKPDAAEIHAVGAQIGGTRGEGGETSREAAERERLQARHAALVRQYCDRYSPQLLAILSDYRDYAKAAIPDSASIEADEAEAQKLQAGVAANVEPGRKGLKPVLEYVRVLSSAYRYDYTK